MKVLIVDDQNSAWDGVAGYLENAAAELGFEPTVAGVNGVAELEARLRRNQRFDVSLVDFGLGAGKSSGLAALEVLKQSGAGGKVAIHADMENTDARLLLTYGAFRWQPTPVALIPKVHAAKGSTYQERARSFSKSILEIAAGRAPQPDIAAPFRRPHPKGADFVDLVSSWGDFNKFQIMIRHTSFGAAAAETGGVTQRFANWGTEKLEKLARFSEQAAEHTKQTGMPITPVPHSARGNNTANHIHAFALSQTLFFTDPAAEKHYADLD